jgi:eukaryotic-like serine/threonine-protein kinase
MADCAIVPLALASIRRQSGAVAGREEESVPAPDPQLPSPGDILLGKYRVEGVLGRGGMGVVVAARHLSLDERVAIKFLLPDRLGDDESIQRFLREARAAVRIRSQHIARVTDVGTMDNGAPYMIMEYLEGRNLQDVVAQDGPLPIALVVDLVLQASEALAEAHAQGIIHRDVKPSNLFLSRHADGSPCLKVLDFGISKMPGSHDHALTRTGAIFGSPLYMSPEQLRSARDVDARTDIYSVGVVLYQSLTRRVPFAADDLPQLVYKIMNEAPVSPRALRAEIPAPLEHAILTAMARDRESRFPTIADLAAAIAPLGSSSARGSAERTRGILRRQPLDASHQPGGRERVGATPVGDDDTAPLVEPKTELQTAPMAQPKTELESSIASFGATRGNPLQPAKGRLAILPVVIGLSVVTLAVVGFALRSSPHVEPVQIVSGSVLGPVPASPSIDAPAALAPVPSAAVPTVPASPSTELSRSAPTAGKRSPRPPQLSGSAQPATPPARRTDKDPFKRDVF